MTSRVVAGRRPRQGVVALATVLVATALTFALPAQASLPSALAQLQAEIALANSSPVLPALTNPPLALKLPKAAFGIASMINNCTPPTNGVVVPYCPYGDVTSSATVVLYGNSQAQSWAPALARLGLADHFRLVPIAKPACGTFVDTGYLDPKNRVSPICSRFVTWAVQRINQLHPALVVVASTPGDVLRPGTDPHQFHWAQRVPPALIVATSPSRTARDFSQLVAALAPSGAKVVLLGPIPTIFDSFDQIHSPAACLLWSPSNVHVCSMLAVTPLNSEWDRAFVRAALASHVAFIDVNSLLCLNGLCPAVVHHVIVDFDFLHISGPYASFVAPALGELLAPYLPSAPAVSHATASL